MAIVALTARSCPDISTKNVPGTAAPKYRILILRPILAGCSQFTDNLKAILTSSNFPGSPNSSVSPRPPPAYNDFGHEKSLAGRQSNEALIQRHFSAATSCFCPA